MQECPKGSFFIIKSVINLCCRMFLSGRWWLAFNLFFMNKCCTVGCKKEVKTKNIKDFHPNLYVKKKNFNLFCLLVLFSVLFCIVLSCLVLLYIVSSRLVLSCLVLSNPPPTSNPIPLSHCQAQTWRQRRDKSACNNKESVCCLVFCLGVLLSMVCLCLLSCFLSCLVSCLCFLLLAACFWPFINRPPPLRRRKHRRQRRDNRACHKNR